jgi:NADPH:quinone reductase-like Zn-dependent oxidoreductase
MSFELASALPVAYSTAYYIANYHLSHLQLNDVVLVHRAGCWCGQAIVELYKMSGAQVFATVQDSTEKLLLSCRFGIPAHHIFVDGQNDVVKSLRRLTDGKRPNLVVSLGIGDEQLQSSTAPFGHFIRLFSDKSRTQGFLRSHNISLSTFNIFDLRKEMRDLADHIWSKVFRLFREGRLKGPSGTAVYNVSHIQQAIEEIPTKRHVVVTAAPDDLVMVSSPFHPKTDLAGSYRTGHTPQPTTIIVPCDCILCSSRRTWWNRT